MNHRVISSIFVLALFFQAASLLSMEPSEQEAQRYRECWEKYWSPAATVADIIRANSSKEKLVINASPERQRFYIEVFQEQFIRLLQAQKMEATNRLLLIPIDQYNDPVLYALRMIATSDMLSRSLEREEGL